jgi:hypothetical protein
LQDVDRALEGVKVVQILKEVYVLTGVGDVGPLFNLAKDGQLYGFFILDKALQDLFELGRGGQQDQSRGMIICHGMVAASAASAIHEAGSHTSNEKRCTSCGKNGLSFLVAHCHVAVANRHDD